MSASWAPASLGPENVSLFGVVFTTNWKEQILKKHRFEEPVLAKSEYKHIQGLI